MSMLFSPITVKDVTFRNRVVMPPMVCVIWPPLADIGSPDGTVTSACVEHYARRAQAGTGLIIVEATAVGEDGRCWADALAAYADRHLPGLSRLASQIQAEGAVASIQLVHGGSQASPELVTARVGPSAVEPIDDDPGVQALTVEEIEKIQQQFEKAAAQVVEAGFNAVEVHGAHGFLLDAFLSSRTNRRTDDYGGEITGRMRMLTETCSRIKERIGDNALLMCRTSIHNKRDEDFTPEDLRQLLTGLKEAGVDLLDVSTDGAFKGYFDSSMTIGKWIKQMCDLPIIVAGGLGNPADAERVVAEGHCDFAAVGTAMLEDPDWAQHAREALE